MHSILPWMRLARQFTMTGLHSRQTLAIAVTFLALQFGISKTATGQQAALARGRSETAQELSKQALECLRQGEDAGSKEAKLTAYQQGLDLATRAVTIDDNNPDAHFAVFANRGRILMIEGAGANPLNLLSVNRELDRTLELDPNHTDALAARGGMYRQLPRLLGGSLAKAEQYLTRAIDLDPNAVGARIELAQTYRDMGKPERGVPLLEQAAQLAERMGKRRQLGQAQSLLRDLNAKQ